MEPKKSHSQPPAPAKAAEPVIPDSTWANWALLQAWFTNQSQGHPLLGTRERLAELIVNRFAAQLSEHGFDGAGAPGPRSFLAVTNAGTWGRGKTLAEAVENSKTHSRTAKVMAWLVLNDEAPYVDQMGTAQASSRAALLPLGIVGTVGSVLNAQPE